MSDPPLVVILCGGRGTRLGALTDELPKPLVPVRGRPFLDHQVALLERQGFARFLFLTGYRGEQIEQYFLAQDARRTRVQFSREQTPLGTAGALVQARDLLPDVFLLLNGDSYLAIDYRRLCAELQATDAVGVVSAYRNPTPTAAIESNNLALQGTAVALYQKRGADPRLTHMDAGAGVYRTSLLDFVLPDDRHPISLEETVWPRVIARRGLLAHLVDEPPFDIGTPARLKAFAERLA